MLGPLEELLRSWSNACAIWANAGWLVESRGSAAIVSDKQVFYPDRDGLTAFLGLRAHVRSGWDWDREAYRLLLEERTGCQVPRDFVDGFLMGWRSRGTPTWPEPWRGGDPVGFVYWMGDEGKSEAYKNGAWLGRALQEYWIPHSRARREEPWMKAVRGTLTWVS